MFKVFNPFTGLHTDAGSLEEAQAIKTDLVSQWVSLQGEKPVVQGLYLYVTGWVEDFYLAYTFMCSKLGSTPLALESITDPDSTGLTQNHAIYNLTTQEDWSRTFRYNTDDGALWHIKVRDGAVTDWYKSGGQVDGVQHAWVTFDLVTGEPFEVYDNLAENVLQKRNLVDNTVSPVVTTFVPFDQLPDDYKSALADWPNRAHIFSWSNRPYGQIVEHIENHFCDPSAWPSDMAAQNAVLCAAADQAAEEKGKEVVTVVSVTTDTAGNEVWSATDV